MLKHQSFWSNGSGWRDTCHRPLRIVQGWIKNLDYSERVHIGNNPLDFGHFRRFLNFAPFFGPFLGTIVKNAKYKKVLSGIYLHLCNWSKNQSVTIWVLKMRFPKMYIEKYKGQQYATATRLHNITKI